MFPRLFAITLDQDPVLPNVPTYLCSDPKQMTYVLEQLPNLVVKAVGEVRWAIGMLIGPAADRAMIEQFRGRITANPRNYIAQPVIALSRVPSYDASSRNFMGCHIDLRPYCLFNGEKSDRGAGRTDARCPPAWLTGCELVPGWRQQRHLGVER